MPKDEFDFADPFELNGMALLTHEDTTNDMAECFTEEFMRMGYNHHRILALFRNPHYLGPHMAYEKRGEPFIRDLIAEVFARWGKTLSWPAETPPLGVSASWRENGKGESATAASPAHAVCSDERPHLFPRPRGGGEGQGEGSASQPSAGARDQQVESGDSLTDPMGDPLPKLNL